MVTYDLKTPLESGQRFTALMSKNGKSAVIYALCPFKAKPQEVK